MRSKAALDQAMISHEKGKERRETKGKGRRGWEEAEENEGKAWLREKKRGKKVREGKGEGKRVRTGRRGKGKGRDDRERNASIRRGKGKERGKEKKWGREQASKRGGRGRKEKKGERAYLTTEFHLSMSTPGLTNLE